MNEGMVTGGVKVGLLATGSSFAAPDGIVPWLACFAFVLFIAAQIKSLLGSKKINITPSPLSVTKAATFATQDELLRAEKMVADVREEMRDGFGSMATKLEAITKVGSDRRAEIHKDLNHHATALAYLAGKLSQMGDDAGAQKVQDLARREG